MPANNKENNSQLEWQDGTIPVSTRFDDPYYSRTDGLAETRHVFLGGNRLPERLAKCDSFTIAELGFGTGLNFLATCQLWAELAPTTARLNYVSFERYPLASSAVEKALSRWPKLETLATAMLAQWTPGFEFCSLNMDNITATVFLSDANVRLPQLDLMADAWFLDGFSPAKNPELWNADLMQAVFDHTAPGGTFATYSAAGWVRRNLEQAGFDVQRVPGFAGKRQMSVGTKS